MGVWPRRYGRVFLLFQNYTFFYYRPLFSDIQNWNLGGSSRVILKISNFWTFFQIFMIGPQWIDIIIYFRGKKSVKSYHLSSSKMLSLTFGSLYFLFWSLYGHETWHSDLCDICGIAYLRFLPGYGCWGKKSAKKLSLVWKISKCWFLSLNIIEMWFLNLFDFEPLIVMWKSK